MTISTETYVRVVIEGELEAVSALHVGDGGDAEFATRGGRAAKGKGHYNTVCLDKDGAAYLPGRTLRGFLRDTCADEDWRKALFGYEERGGDGRSGAIRVYDARIVKTPPGASPASGKKEELPPYFKKDRHTGVAHHVSIDPITGTADEHKLFRREFVPAGTRFNVRLEAADVTKESIEQVLGLLAALDGSVNASVGRGVSKAHGRLKWEKTKPVKVLTQQKFAEWLKSDDGAFDHLMTELTGIKAEPPKLKPKPRPLAEYKLIMTSPLLVNESGYAGGKDGDPDLEFARTPDGRPMIPAESIAGMVRGRARRILATLLHASGAPAEKASRIAEEKLADVFGSTGQRSALRFKDAVAGAKQDGITQWFNAIDRFTGGVDAGSKSEEGKKKGGKLYQARSARGADLSLSAAVYLDEKLAPMSETWWKGLLLLALRDAMEGDLAVGWGKARGYGRFRLELTLDGSQSKIASWEDFLGYLNAGKRSEADGWVKSLSLRETAKAWGEAAKSAGQVKETSSSLADEEGEGVETKEEAA